MRVPCPTTASGSAAASPAVPVSSRRRQPPPLGYGSMPPNASMAPPTSTPGGDELSQRMEQMRMARDQDVPHPMQRMMDYRVLRRWRDAGRRRLGGCGGLVAAGLATLGRRRRLGAPLGRDGLAVAAAAGLAALVDDGLAVANDEATPRATLAVMPRPTHQLERATVRAVLQLAAPPVHRDGQRDFGHDSRGKPLVRNRWMGRTGTVRWRSRVRNAQRVGWLAADGGGTETFWTTTSLGWHKVTKERWSDEYGREAALGERVVERWRVRAGCGVDQRRDSTKARSSSADCWFIVTRAADRLAGRRRRRGAGRPREEHQREHGLQQRGGLGRPYDVRQAYRRSCDGRPGRR